MKILVTGSTGFLGLKLMSRIIENGWKVGILVRDKNTNTSAVNLNIVLKNKANNSDNKDVLSVEVFNPDVIIHLACCYGRKNEKPSIISDVNIQLGLRIIDSVLGLRSDSLLFINAGTSLSPDTSNYALSKHQFSEWGKKIAKTEGARLKFIDVRIQQIYGENDDRSKFTANVIEACRNNEQKIDMSHGEQYRDFIYVDDVVSAFENLIKHAHKLREHEIIDLGSGQCVKLRDFVELVHSISGASTVLNFGATPYRQGEQMYSVADLSRMNELGWTPKYSLKCGVNRVLKN